MTYMIKSGTPPPYSSTAEPRHIVVPIEPDIKIHPTPSDPPYHTNPQRQAEWQTPLQNFERPMISYQYPVREVRVIEQGGAGSVAQAMDNVADSQTNPKVKVKKLRKADRKEREGVVVGILKGLLILVTSPFYIVGATFQATGVLLDGLGFFFKSTGQLLKKLTYTGGSSSNRSSASVNTATDTP